MKQPTHPPSARLLAGQVAAPPASWRLTVVAAGLIVLAAGAAYHNSFAGPFIHDDVDSIVKNPTIRQWTAIRQVLSPPAGGQTVSGRPLLNATLALNYAMGGLNVRGYHGVNLLVHMAAALVLFGILRRTFGSARLRERFGRANTALALAITLVWTLHPLQTESVTYIVQRAESLAGLFYLLTLYCVIRGATVGDMLSRCEASGEHGDSEALPPCRPAATPRDGMPPATHCPPASGHRFWYVAAVLACLLGMATKEVMATAPLLVFLYDRTFLAGSFREALRRRWPLYAGLAATWSLLLYLVLTTGLIYDQPAMGATNAWSYTRGEPSVIVYYVRLSLWPAQLCQQYSWAVTSRPAEVLPGGLVIGVLLAVTVWGLIARKTWSFLGAWFFLILAPTSSFFPLGQLAYEHRMYLSLAAVATLAILTGYVGCDQWLRGLARPGRPAAMILRVGPVAVLLGVIVALGCATAARNREYRSTFMPFQDAINRLPQSPVAHYNFAIAMTEAGRPDAAIEHYQEALRLNPDYAEAHNNLGIVLADLGRTSEAIEHYQQALRLNAVNALAQGNLGTALIGMGKMEEGIAHYQEALRVNPGYAAAYNNLGVALTALGRTDEAVEHYQQALRLNPAYADAHVNLGIVLAKLGRTGEAIEHYRQALRLNPDDALPQGNLAAALAATGKTDEAIEHYREAARLAPDDPKVHYSLAKLLADGGNTGEAIEHYRQTVRLKPDFLVALNDLAWLLATHDPAQGGDATQAVQLAQRARELGGGENPQSLDTLAAAYAAAGRFADAVSTAEKALGLAASGGQEALVQRIQSRLALYRTDRPYRTPPDAPIHP